MIIFYPEANNIYLGTALIGGGTGVIGGRIGSASDHDPAHFGNTEILRDGNDIVVEIYWLEDKRKSEVGILEKAEEHAKRVEGPQTQHEIRTRPGTRRLIRRLKINHTWSLRTKRCLRT